LTCSTLVPAKTNNKVQAIGFLKAFKKMVLSRLDKALVERTVYPPNKAQIPTSIPMRRSPYFDSERKMSPERATRVRMV